MATGCRPTGGEPGVFRLLAVERAGGLAVVEVSGSRRLTSAYLYAAKARQVGTPR